MKQLFASNGLSGAIDIVENELDGGPGNAPRSSVAIIPRMVDRGPISALRAPRPVSSPAK